MTGVVKDVGDDFRRNVVGSSVPRGGRYYLRPDYVHPHSLDPSQGHHHQEGQRHDFSNRDFLPPDKIQDMYGRHKDNFFPSRSKDREELLLPSSYGAPPTPEDPFMRVSSSIRGPRIGDRFPRIQDYTSSSPAPESRNSLYGPGGPPSVPIPLIPGVPPGGNTTTSNSIGNGNGADRLPRLLDLYGTLDNRQQNSRSHHDIYGSLDGRGSRLSDIFPASESRVRASEYRSDETRSLSGREGALSDIYKRRDLPPAPPEYFLHDFRPRHDFRNVQKPLPPSQVPQQTQHGQDVIENPMYDVERRNGPPRTPGPKVPTPTTTSNTVHHVHHSHLASSSSPTPGHHLHPSFNAGFPTPSHSTNHSQNISNPHGLSTHSVVMGNNHAANHPSTLTSGHPQMTLNMPSVPGNHSTVNDRGEIRYTTAIAQQDEAHRRIAASNRAAENQRSLSNPVSSLGPNMGSSQSRSQPQNNQMMQHQHSLMPSNSTSNSPSTNTVTPSQSQTTTNHPSTPCSAQSHSGGSSHAQVANVPQANTVQPSCSRPQHRTLNRSISRKDQIRNYVKKETKEFFGLDDEDEADSRQKLKWENKRRRLASRKYGPLRESALDGHVCCDRMGGGHSKAAQSLSSDCHALHDMQSSRPTSYFTDMADGNAVWPRPPPIKGKDSVAKMTWDGLTYMISTVSKCRVDSQSSGTPGGRSKSRSYAPSSPSPPEEFSDEQDAATSSLPTSDQPLESIESEVFFDGKVSGGTPDSDGKLPSFETNKEVVTSASRYHPSVQGQWKLSDVVQQLTAGVVDTDGPSGGRTNPRIGRCRIWSRLLDHCFDNSDRRQYGLGVFGKYCRRKYRNSVQRNAEIRKQLDEIEDYRPYFTWWVTTVQVFILLLSILCYGFAPHGVSIRQQHGQVLMASLSIQTVDYWEPENLWIGPRAADLIHLGAKFAACMRIDEKIFRHVEEQRRLEKETGCCIRNDDSGCVQSSRRECSPIGASNMDSSRLSVWKKWSELAKGPDGRMSGSVCGQDPNFCKEPASVPPHEWPDDITRWPICKKRVAVSPVRKVNTAEHMACEVIGHPCCIGIHGECRITTREYCNFVRGYFHEEATLCSQVSCLNDVCGMIPFYSPDRPDQFYRLWTSLFIHAGLFHLLITILLQYCLMRDLEKLAGPVRIGIIYIVSGIAGNLASAIFVPYRAEVGPSGSQFGLLACLFVEVINCWPLIRYPWRALLRLVAVTLVLFIVGLLPWVDNYAHIFGFIFGFLLSYALLPYVSFGPYDRHRKVLLIWVCLAAVIVMLVALIVLFYVTPIYECKICELLNCIPLTRDFCAEQNINFDKKISFVS